MNAPMGCTVPPLCRHPAAAPSLAYLGRQIRPLLGRPKPSVEGQERRAGAPHRPRGSPLGWHTRKGAVGARRSPPALMARRRALTAAGISSRVTCAAGTHAPQPAPCRGSSAVPRRERAAIGKWMRWNACELVWRAAGEGRRVSRDAERPPFGPPSQPQLLHGLLDRHPPGAMRAADPWRPAGSGGGHGRGSGLRGGSWCYIAPMVGLDHLGPILARARVRGRPADTILPLENVKSHAAEVVRTATQSRFAV